MPPPTRCRLPLPWGSCWLACCSSCVGWLRMRTGLGMWRTVHTCSDARDPPGRVATLDCPGGWPQETGRIPDDDRPHEDTAQRSEYEVKHVRSIQPGYN